MKTVVIDRAKWAIPRQTSAPMLLDSDTEETRGESLCCLGFLARSCGISNEAMESVSIPSELESPGRMPKRLFEIDVPHKSSGEQSNWESVFAWINDAEDIDDATREAWVREGFKRILKRRVRFVGKYAVKEPKNV